VQDGLHSCVGEPPSHLRDGRLTHLEGLQGGPLFTGQGYGWLLWHGNPPFWLSIFSFNMRLPHHLAETLLLIDKNGIVRKIWHKVKPEEHANEVLEAADELGL
jgi:hypothetical protein